MNTRVEGSHVLIGTSGYSYREWVGAFYPPGTNSREYLSYYAGHFDFTELNYSYYRMPDPHQTSQIVHKARSANPGFRLSIKAHRSLTHERDHDAPHPRAVEAFRRGIEPLLADDALLCVLAQFPFSFHYQDSERRYLDALCEALSGLPLAVEFRNRDWQRESVFRGLQDRDVSYVVVDTPDLRGLPEGLVRSTSGLSYLRLHGRNSGAWWSGDARSRYQYNYADEELQEWLPGIHELESQSEILAIAFNNHADASAPLNATKLAGML